MVADLDSVSHDGHLVERGLSVEEHDVVVLHVPLDRPPHVESHAAGRRHVAQVGAAAVLSHHVHGARVLVGPVLDQLLQLLDVELGHALRHRQRLCDGPGHADLQWRKEGGKGEVHWKSLEPLRIFLCSSKNGATAFAIACLWWSSPLLIHAAARTWSICRLGSAVMTVRPEKSTRLPIRLPRMRPSLPLRRCAIVLSTARLAE